MSSKRQTKRGLKEYKGTKNKLITGLLNTINQINSMFRYLDFGEAVVIPCRCKDCYWYKSVDCHPICEEMSPYDYCSFAEWKVED